MQSNKYVVTISSGDALGSNTTFAFQIRGAATLLEVSACGSNDGDATFTFGTSADPNGILTAATVGDSSVPTIWGRDDWDGALYTDADNINYLHFADNTVFHVVVDYDGASGTAVQDLMICIWFDEA
jgi:hypothetical protein